MADVSRSVYLSKKLSGLIDDHTSSKHAYDGVFSSPPAPTKNKLSTSRIDDFREIFTPSSVSLGSSIPILDLPAVDLTGRALSGADYAGVFGGFADSDGIGPPPEEMIQLAKTMPKRDAHPPRSPVQMRRMPSKSQEFSFNNGNDQTSSLAQMRRVPSKSQEFSLSNGNAQTSSTAQARRVPSRSQEFSFSNGNDQTSSTAQARRMPSKSQEFSCNYGNDQTSNSAQVTGMPSKSQQFSSNYANDQRSTSAQTMRMPSKSKEFSRNYGNEQRSTPVQTMRMPSKSQEFPCNYDNDQRSTPAQTMRMPSKSQEFLCNNGNDQASTPTQTMRMPSKSQEFPCNYGHGEKTSPVQTKRMPSKSQEFPSNHGNDQTSSSAHPRMESSKSQEFSRNLSNNHMSSSPLQAGMPFLRGDEISGDPLNDQVSESTLPHQTVDGVKHVSVSYHQTKQLSKDGTDGMTHIAHLHAVPGYTLLFDDEAGPVRKSGFDKAKRLSMDDADFSSDAGKVSKQGKHTRAVSDLGTNKQASDYDHGGGDNHFAASHDARQNRSMSVSNSPQSSGGSDYFKRAASRRPNGSKKIQEKNAVRDPFPLLELDVNSDAAVSAAAMKRAIEEAEEKIRWAKEFLMGLESIGFITPTLKDSFKVKATSDTYHSYEAYAPKQNGSLKVNATRQKKCINEDRVRRRNGSGVNSHANEAGRAIPKDDLHRVAAQVETTMRSPSAPDTLEESPESVQYSDSVIDGEVVDNTNAPEELNLTEKSGKYEGVGEWEAAKHLSQIFTGVKNRLVSFISKQADVEKTVIQNEAQSKYESLEQERAYKVRNLDTVQDRAADLERVEEKVEMSHSTCSVVRDSAQESIGISVDMEILEAEVNKDNGSGATSSRDVEMLTSKQCGQSEPEEVVKYIEAKETENITNELNQDVHTEVKGELLQEVRVQNQEIFDATMQTEHESQMGPIELEERDENDETVNQVQGLEPVKERVIESIDNEAVNSRQVEGCNLKEIEIPKDAQTKQEDVGMVEETCMLEELCERVVEAEEIHAGGEDVEEVAGQDVTSEATEGLTEVFGDVSEHDEHLAAVDDATEQDKLFISKNEEASVPDETIQYAPSVRSPSEDKGKMTESAAVPFEPREDIEESKSVHRGSELLREGICEQPRCSIEVVDDDDSELDEYLPANDDILEQDELISSTRNADATEHNNVSQYALNVDLPSQEESRTEATSTTSEPEGNIEKPGSVQMANDELSRGYKFVDSGSGSEVADESLEHDDYVPATDDVCEKDEHSCLNRNAEAYDQDENQYAQEVKVAAGEERMATDAGTSEFEETEQPSSTQKANELVGEQMTEKIFIPAGDTLVLDETEKEIEEAHEVHRCTDDGTTECDTVYKFEMKHCDEETRNFPTNIRPGNQDDESDVSTREANEASEQDVSSHDGELSHKRRRWFEKKEEVGELQRPGIFKENEKVLEMDQENAEGFKAEDRVEISVEEIANESGEGVHMEQGDAGSGQDQEGEGLHSTEGTHRRRRWFENSGEKIQLRPSPFTGVGVTEEIDHEIAPEFKEEISSQSVVDQLVNERKDGAESADGMDSNMANDQVECRASTEAGHRRRRWFESKEKSGAAQRPGPTILENNEAAAELEEEMAMTADTAKHELRESSTSGDLASTNKREEHNKEREKEKERLVVERAIREVRQRAFAEARERAAAEARLKAAAASQDKQGKASSEAKPSSDKASMDAKLKSERAAVERATSEARERALQKSMSDKAAFKSFEKDPNKNQCSGPSSSSGYSTSVSSTSDRSNGAVNESPQRRKAISERNKRTTERAAKALEEKNMRDVIAQKEQAERTRFANALDADVKRWSSGKEGNLRSLLSTLQYILSPDSGWQPIPLTDLVSTTAIRKAYKRAALCVHPDKLQQRGATIQQKYICEKVFDLLKDAWNKLNPEDR